VIERKLYCLRPWRTDDAPALTRHADNPRIAGNLRDAFPSPYTIEDARRWLEMVGGNRSDVILAIEVEGEAAGGIGLHVMKDVYRYNGEIGYWLSESYWGRGIMTGAVEDMVTFAFIHTEILRLYASIFEHNTPSMRVLEKNGFILEAIIKKSVMKEGILLDENLFSLLREHWDQGNPLPHPRGRALAQAPGRGKPPPG
jgi:ribosomal-protein-alanine N-acetyltransferase